MERRFVSKLFSFIFAVFMVFGIISPLFATEVLAEEKVITIFSWEDYIDEGYDDPEEDAEVLLQEGYSREELETSLLDIFEEEYGIKVNYHTFATNEEMYNELLKDPTAVDLICPSEYMIMKMKDEGLIKPYTMPQNYIDYGSPYIKSVFDKLNMNLQDEHGNVKSYAIGYMWGTMGLIYNAEKYTDEDLKSWTNLFDDEFKGKLTIKDSLRDSYILAIGIVYKDELLALKNKLDTDSTYTEETYKDDLFKIFNRTDSETIDKVGDVLDDLKYNLHSFEVDGGKSDLLTGKIDVNFAWSGDAVYSMYEGDKVDKKLGYVVPEEGSNVWFDGWVMTKDANEENALKFLEFVSKPRVAVRNMNYIGYTSCIAGDDVFTYVTDNFGDDEGNREVDLGYFFGAGNYKVKVSDSDDGYYRHLYAQYADEETIMRCAVMDNFSDSVLEEINDMWSKVKLITFPTYAIILIVVLIVLIIAGLVIYKFKDKIFRKVPAYVDGKVKHKNCKIIKKVEIR